MELTRPLESERNNFIAPKCDMMLPRFVTNVQIVGVPSSDFSFIDCITHSPLPNALGLTYLWTLLWACQGQEGGKIAFLLLWIGYSIFVVMDRFSKIAHFILDTSVINAPHVESLFI